MPEENEESGMTPEELEEEIEEIRADLEETDADINQHEGEDIAWKLTM